MSAARYELLVTQVEDGGVVTTVIDVEADSIEEATDVALALPFVLGVERVLCRVELRPIDPLVLALRSESDEAIAARIQSLTDGPADFTCGGVDWSGAAAAIRRGDDLL